MRMMRLMIYTNLIFIKMIRDTIYNDLKQQGLILSEGVALQLPPIRPPKVGIVQQIGGFFAPEFKLKQGPYKTIILPILNSAVLVGRANTLICYKFQLNKQTGVPIFVEPKVQNLPYVIKALHICDSKYLTDRGQVPFLLESDDRLVLFYVDLKQFKLIERNSLPYSNVFSIRFLFEKEVLLLTENLELHHFGIFSGKIKLKAKISSKMSSVPKDQYIQHCQIVGNIDEEHDSIITLFYLIKKKKKVGPKGQDLTDRKFQILKVKEYLRSFDGHIEPQDEDFTVMSNNHSSVLPDKFQIWFFDGFYCIETKHEILILKKKFKKYLFIDNVMEKIHEHNLRLNSGAIISSYGNNSMELSVIQFGDPKCVSKILDTIELTQEESQGFKLLWPFKNEKQTCLMLAFEQQKRIIFHNIVKMEPMKKMLEVVKNIDKNKISVVQQIAVNLGINKKDFYLTLWQSSKRQIPDIYQFLLPCGDVTSIKKQIRLTMRRKKIVVVDFLKILEKISHIIKNELKTNLTQLMLKEYIKNDFLLRKIKLKDKNKPLDHRDLDKVYNSSVIDMFVEIIKNDLYPQEKKYDPLHAMVDVPEKQIINLSHVFQQFRIVILENYKKFIHDLFVNFTYDQLVNVIRNYSYLLPFYPFELNMIMHETQYKTEEELKLEMVRHNFNGQQNLWFLHMTSVQFNRELSKERIEKELHEYYPTSKIADAINTLVNSPYGATEKLRKHGLISCTIDQYKTKLKDIYNIKLFLKVCEIANEQTSYEEVDITPDLVEIFKTENRLTGQAYETVRLYTSMHRFMLRNEFCEKKNNDRSGFSTEELMQFTPEDLVALFFLQNRQRKEFIFNQFRDLYFNLYNDAIKFNQVIQKFIRSENCSRIQLQIFIKEVDVKGIDFQKNNQPLIELLIDGFCLKLQIRQDSDTKHFIELMENIELNKDLGMKINKIIQIRKCLIILNVFQCQKLTYFEMLQYQKDNKIFKILLERYFNQQTKKQSVRIQDQEISLQFCRNMLTVLLYILETIYYDVKEKQLLLTYGEMLIQWKQFDVIKGILYDEDVLEKLNINKVEYVQELVNNALISIYTDQDIEFDEETKRQIQDILDILQDQASVICRKQYAKLNLVKIFESWSAVVHPFDIYSVCQEWNQNDGREDFIINLFHNYLDHLNILSLEAVYKNLQLTGNLQSEDREVNIQTSQFVHYVLMFAQRLLKKERYSEIIEIFAFVKKINGTTIEYELMTEAFLKEVCILYPTSETMNTGKELIQYFTQCFFDDLTLQHLFQSNFQSGKFNSEFERQNEISVDTKNYTFGQNNVDISLDLLWKIVEDEIKERECQKKLTRSYNEELFYSYYFLIMVFRNPHNGLKKLDRITYNLEILTNLLFRLQAAVDQNNSLWAINCFYIFKSFIKGLLLIGVARFKQTDEKMTAQRFKQREENIEVIKNVLKENKAQNKDLLDSIMRLENHTNAAKLSKKNEKEIRFEKGKLMEMQNRPKELKQPEPQPEVLVNNATMNLRTMRDMKFQYTQLSNMSIDFISEKQVLEAIYHRRFEQTQQKSKNRNLQKNNLFLPGIDNVKRQKVQKELVQKIINDQLESLITADKEDLTQALKTVYTDGSKGFYDVIMIMEEIKIGDKRKQDLGRYCKIYQGDIPTEDLAKIFPFQYFIDNERYSEDELSERTYEYIGRNIQKLFAEKDNEYVRSMASFIGSVLQSNIYIDKIYIETLISLGQQKEIYSFTQETIIRLRMIIDLLNQNNPEMIRENLSRILDAYQQKIELRAIVKQELQLVIKHHFPLQAPNLLEFIKNA